METFDNGRTSFSAKIKGWWASFLSLFRRNGNISGGVIKNPKTKNWRLILVTVITSLLFLAGTSALVFAVGLYRYGWEPAELSKPVLGFKHNATYYYIKALPYPAAIVGLDTVTMNEFYDEFSYVDHFYQKTGQTPPDKSVLKKQVLDQLVERNILEHQARLYNVSVAGSEVDEEFQKIADENGGTAEVEKVLGELYGLSTSNFKNLIRAQLLKEKLRDEVPMQFKAKHILIKWTSKDGVKKKRAALAKIRRLRTAIINGKTTFEKMAKTYSEDAATKNKSGDLGWVQRGQMVEEFETALFKLKKDEVSEPVLTKFGYHLIKVDDIKGKVDKSFADWIEDVINKTKVIKLIK